MTASLGLLSVLLFASTNVDDLFVLAAFYANPRFRARDVVIGQFAGIGALVTASLVVSVATLAIPTRWIGFLGILPVVLGLRMWWRARNATDDDESPTRDARTDNPITTVAVVTIANGADNVAAYVPFFATVRDWHLAMVVGVFAIMTGAWCFAAHWLVQHQTLGAPIRRYGATFLPFVLMALGVYLLIEGGAYSVVANVFRGNR